MAYAPAEGLDSVLDSKRIVNCETMFMPSEPENSPLGRNQRALLLGRDLVPVIETREILVVRKQDNPGYGSVGVGSGCIGQPTDQLPWQLATRLKPRRFAEPLKSANSAQEAQGSGRPR